MNKHLRLFFMAALGFSTLSLFSQSFTERADSFISAFTGVQTFSGDVLVGSGDSILFHKAYGKANYEWNIPNEGNSVYRIGSLSEAFTAAMILKLSEQGKINLSSSASEYLPEYSGIFSDSITVHQLLTHTSGVPHYDAKKLHNSGFDYYLLGAIIERVSSIPLNDYLRESILIPADMKNTCFDDMTSKQTYVASGYNYDHSGIIRSSLEDRYKSKGYGGLVSTAEDMFKWIRSIKHNVILSYESVKMMFSRHDGLDGYGWKILDEKTGDRQCIVATIAGSDFGFASRIWYNLDDDLCVIILSNVETAPLNTIEEGVNCLLNGEDVKPPLIRSVASITAEELVGLSGSYKVSPDYTISIFEGKKGLLVNWTGLNDKLLMFPMASDTFFIRENNKIFIFNRNCSGQVTSLSFCDNEGVVTATRETRVTALSELRQCNEVAEKGKIKF